MKYKSRSIGNKWTKTKWLLGREDLKRHVPYTLKFDKPNLIAMLNTHDVIYFKPTYGSGGANIIRIKKREQDYQTKANSGKAVFATIDQLYDHLKKRSARRAYLLQRGITLARTNGRPFDIRVMVQKTNEGKWISTALFTKIGRPGRVATNYNQGGRVGYIRPALTGAGYSADSSDRIVTRLKQMGTAAGRCFDRHKKGLRELGLDVALDQDGYPWILEVNTRPQFYPLKNFKNKALYRRIVSYAKQYGRKY